MLAYNDLLLDKAANDTAAEFVREKIGEIVQRSRDGEDCCSPRTTRSAPSGICVDTDYYETFNRPNVTLVDLRPIRSRRSRRMRVRTGAREYAFDAIVLATGFDAMTGALPKIDIAAATARR